MPSKKKRRQPSPKSKSSRSKKSTVKKSLFKQLTGALVGLGVLVIIVVSAGYFIQKYLPETHTTSEQSRKIHGKSSSPPLKFEIYPKEKQAKQKEPEPIPPGVETPGGLPRVCIIRPGHCQVPVRRLSVVLCVTSLLAAATAYTTIDIIQYSNTHIVSFPDYFRSFSGDGRYMLISLSGKQSSELR